MENTSKDPRIRCLLVENNPKDVLDIMANLERVSEGMIDIYVSRSLDQSRKMLVEYKPDVVLMNLRLPDSDTRSTYYTVVREAYPIPVIMLAGSTQIMRQGSFQGVNENLFCKDDLDYERLWERILKVTPESRIRLESIKKEQVA